MTTARRETGSSRVPGAGRPPVRGSGSQRRAGGAWPRVLELVPDRPRPGRVPGDSLRPARAGARPAAGEPGCGVESRPGRVLCCRPTSRRTAAATGVESLAAPSFIEPRGIIGIVAVLPGLLPPAGQKMRAAAARVRCQNSLERLGLGGHLYHDAVGALPPGVDPIQRPVVPDGLVRPAAAVHRAAAAVAGDRGRLRRRPGRSVRPAARRVPDDVADVRLPGRRAGRPATRDPRGVAGGQRQLPGGCWAGPGAAPGRMRSGRDDRTTSVRSTTPGATTPAGRTRGLPTGRSGSWSPPVTPSRRRWRPGPESKRSGRSTDSAGRPLNSSGRCAKSVAADRPGSSGSAMRVVAAVRVVAVLGSARAAAGVAARTAAYAAAAP